MPYILYSVGFRSRLFGGQKKLEVHRGDHDVLDYCIFGVEAACTECLGKYAEKIISIRIYRNWYCSSTVYNQIAIDMFEETNNFVHIVTTDKL